MKLKPIFLTSLIIATWLLILFKPATSFAQSSTKNGIKLSINPLPVLLTTKPGETISYEFKVKNSGTQPETLEPSLLTFISDNKTGDPQLKNPGDNDVFLEWISFAPKKINLKPDEWGSSLATIRIPENAAHGYYFAVTWSRSHDLQATPAATNLQGSVAQLVLMEVTAAGQHRELRVDSFKSSHKFYEFLPVSFTTTISNLGNIHLAPYGSIFISQGENQLGEIVLNKERGNILPNSLRAFTASWEQGFPLYLNKESNGSAILNEKGQPIQELNWDLERAEWWRFGKYTAKLVMAYEREGKDIPLVAETSFWVIPWRLILVAVIIPLIPTLLMYLFMRRRLVSQRG